MSSSALRNRNFLIYLSGATISLHGLWIYRVALGWFAWQLTGSEFWVGVVAFSQFAPAVVFGPLFGVFADRINRRYASLFVNSMTTLNMIVLATLTFTNNVDIYVLTAVSLAQGMLEGAHIPIRMTLVPGLVTKEQLPSAIASNSIAFNVSRLVGPAISGLIIAIWGVGTAFAVNAASYTAILVAVLCVRLRPRERKKTHAADVFSELADGFRYAFTHTSIRALFVIVAVASVFGRGALEMLPAFADDVFQGGAETLALLTSSVGGGAIIAGLVLGRSGRKLTVGAVRLAVIAAGLLIAVFGYNDHLLVAVPLVTTLGIILTFCGVGSQILIQGLVDDDVRGRVTSLWGMIAFGGTALGSVIVGAAAEAFGLQGTVIVTGLLCFAAAALSSP